MTMAGWHECEAWLNGVVFDDPAMSDRVEMILHPERFVSQAAATNTTMRAIEDTVEQNDNQFDGIINNLPDESPTGAPDPAKAAREATETAARSSVLEKLREEERMRPPRPPRPFMPDHEESIRNLICMDIDRILQGPPAPKDFEEFLKKLQEAGYEIKTGKNISIRGKNQKRFVRLSSLSEGYREADLRQYFLNPTVRKTQSRPVQRKERISLLIDVQEKLQTKGPGYARWAKVHNLKEMSKSLLFLREHGIDSSEDLHALVDKKVAERDALRDAVQSMEKRITEITALRKHIYNYSDTRATYEAYRKAGYSKKFFEAHREELTIHKAAKKAFDELDVKKIPRVKELNVEYAELMKEKKAKFREYRAACSEAREYLAIRENIASLYDAERKENADRKKRKEQER